MSQEKWLRTGQIWAQLEFFMTCVKRNLTQGRLQTLAWTDRRGPALPGITDSSHLHEGSFVRSRGGSIPEESRFTIPVFLGFESLGGGQESFAEESRFPIPEESRFPIPEETRFPIPVFTCGEATQVNGW